MDEWKNLLNNDPMDWLLESDKNNPGVRYFALRDLIGGQEDDPEVLTARRAVMEFGPVPGILAQQGPEGYWVNSGPGYNPKYRSTVWSVILLAQFGADGNDPLVRRGCEYLLSHALASNGAFSINGSPSASILCLGGNLAAALVDLGWLGDKRLDGAMEWLARAVTGLGVVGSREVAGQFPYYRSGTCGPGFACSGNNRLPCAWGAVKVLMALGKVPADVRTPAVRRAIETGVDFLLSRDPSVADYPAGWSKKPSGSWFKLGFPLFYVTDVLQNLAALVGAGVGRDPRLERAVDVVLSKQGADGRWKLEYTYNGKTWVDVESKSKPSKWVTLRALRVLKGLVSKN